ncbi:hypothetical protein [Helicobacter sp.]|uniref:hypothetical protein n=1 Tax=Helicobacter sp. TaxID=218 RepID=UPI00388FB752
MRATIWAVILALHPVLENLIAKPCNTSYKHTTGFGYRRNPAQSKNQSSLPPSRLVFS